MFNLWWLLAGDFNLFSPTSNIYLHFSFHAFHGSQLVVVVSLVGSIPLDKFRNAWHIWNFYWLRISCMYSIHPNEAHLQFSTHTLYKFHIWKLEGAPKYTKNKTQSIFHISSSLLVSLFQKFCISLVYIFNTYGCHATSPKCNLYESQSGLTFSGSRSYYIYIPYQTTFHKLYPGFDLVISIRNVVQIAKAMGEMSIGMDTASENRIIRREFNGIKQRDESKAFV